MVFLLLVLAVRSYGNDTEAISAAVGSKSAVQCRAFLTHCKFKHSIPTLLAEHQLKLRRRRVSDDILSEGEGQVYTCLVAYTHTHSRSASTVAVQCAVACVAVVLCWCYSACTCPGLVHDCRLCWWMVDVPFCLRTALAKQPAIYEELYWLIAVWHCIWCNDTQLHEGDYMWSVQVSALGGAHENSSFE